MKVELLHHTPLEVSDIAICKCYDNTPHSDLVKIQKRISSVANVSKHASTIEHLSYSFDIDGISRACLQELARHRVASYTVKSSRYTLQELKDADDILEKGFMFFTEEAGKIATKFIVFTGNQTVDGVSIHNLGMLQRTLKKGIANDIAKYCMPEAYKTSLVMTINARSLQNFLHLRTNRKALWEIRELAKRMYYAIPEEHKFLFNDSVTITNDTI